MAKASPADRIWSRIIRIYVQESRTSHPCNSCTVRAKAGLQPECRNSPRECLSKKFQKHLQRIWAVGCCGGWVTATWQEIDSYWMLLILFQLKSLSTSHLPCHALSLFHLVHINPDPTSRRLGCLLEKLGPQAGKLQLRMWQVKGAGWAKGIESQWIPWLLFWRYTIFLTHWLVSGVFLMWPVDRAWLALGNMLAVMRPKPSWLNFSKQKVLCSLLRIQERVDGWRRIQMWHNVALIIKRVVPSNRFLLSSVDLVVATKLVLACLDRIQKLSKSSSVLCFVDTNWLLFVSARELDSIQGGSGREIMCFFDLSWPLSRLAYPSSQRLREAAQAREHQRNGAVLTGREPAFWRDLKLPCHSLTLWYMILIWYYINLYEFIHHFERSKGWRRREGEDGALFSPVRFVLFHCYIDFKI